MQRGKYIKIWVKKLVNFGKDRGQKRHSHSISIQKTPSPSQDKPFLVREKKTPYLCNLTSQQGRGLIRLNLLSLIFKGRHLGVARTITRLLKEHVVRAVLLKSCQSSIVVPIDEKDNTSVNYTHGRHILLHFNVSVQGENCYSYYYCVSRIVVDSASLCWALLKVCFLGISTLFQFFQKKPLGRVRGVVYDKKLIRWVREVVKNKGECWIGPGIWQHWQCGLL